MWGGGGIYVLLRLAGKVDIFLLSSPIHLTPFSSQSNVHWEFFVKWGSNTKLSHFLHDLQHNFERPL